MNKLSQLGNVKYVGYYDTLANEVENRQYVLSAKNLMDYVASTINEIGLGVDFISMSRTNNMKSTPIKKYSDYNGNSVLLFFSLGFGNRVNNKICQWLLQIQLFVYLLVNIRKNENIIVYHSLYYMSVLLALKKIKRFELTLQVGEIYQDLVECKTRVSKKELKLFEVADSYIFSSSMLNEKVNIQCKNSMIIYGVYNVRQEAFKVNSQNSKIHLVYAGTFDIRKGIEKVLDLAPLLPENYVLNIAGFGTKNEIDYVKERVAQINKVNESKVVYHGKLDGNKYYSLLEKSDIGLSLQDMNAKFNDTSFPSKILSYMSHGLSVVTVDLMSIRKSPFDKYVHYVDETNDLLQVVMSVEIGDKESTLKLMNRLHADVKLCLRDMMKRG